MAEIFPPEHYRTAEQYGVDFTDEYPEAEILAEVDLTLSVLLEQDVGVSFSRDDLEAYHYLQYGGLRGSSRFAISMVMSGEDGMLARSGEIKQRLSSLQPKLGYVLAPDKLSDSLPLGRFPIGWIPSSLKLPEEFVDLFSATVPIYPIPARNPGPFLYPKKGVSLSYAGTEKTDTDLGQLLFNELAECNPSLVERCLPNIGRADLAYPDDAPTLHLEHINAEDDGSVRSFTALSSEAVLLAVEPSASFDVDS